jgi:hypothetical protein
MDEYQRLRPYTDDPSCDCASIEKLLLVHILTANPIRCFKCKGLVDPEGLHLTRPQVEAVATWHSVFGALYSLWLDSGEYEPWAKAQLLRSDGHVNAIGMAARASLAEIRPTYYWWFRDTNDEIPTCCPWCAQTLVASERHGVRQCNSCSIVV